MAETNGNVTKQDLKEALEGVAERIAQLIAGEVGTLHNDMQAGFDRVDKRLESIDTRLKLQAGLIQSGARAMARFSEFAETSEERWVALVTRIEALEKWKEERSR
jgi:hypothetical protein